MNPLIVEGSRLLIPSLLTALNSVPPAQLAKFGLARAKVAAIPGGALALAGGAALAVLAIPPARSWAKEKLREGSTHLEKLLKSTGTSVMRSHDRDAEGAHQEPEASHLASDPPGDGM